MHDRGTCAYRTDPGHLSYLAHSNGRRTDLAGWQLDQLAANPKGTAGDAESDSDSDADIPFACLICRKPYTEPVVTRCGHYYCSTCAIKRYGKTPKCLACGAPTGGIFNRADKVISKLNGKKTAADSTGDEFDIEGLGGK